MPITEWLADKLVDKVKRDAVHAASREGANAVARHARSLAPWDSGDLATSIKVIKSKFVGGGHLVIADGTDKFHASFVELGANIHPYGNKSTSKVKMKKQPFLRPALLAERNKIQEAYRDKL